MGTMEGQTEQDDILDNNFAIELLDSWGVSEESRKVFKEHELDLFCIENITESDINELIPSNRIKDRIKLNLRPDYLVGKRRTNHWRHITSLVENMETTYIPARGKLVDRYHNQRRVLRKSGRIDEKRTTYTTTTPTAVIVEEPDFSLEDENSIKLWLKFNKEPWVEIKQKWKLSQRLRNLDLKSNNSIQDIINKWPSLKSNLGYNLIESDFDVIFPNCELELFKKWPHFMEKSLPVYKKLTACEEILKILGDNPGEGESCIEKPLATLWRNYQQSTKPDVVMKLSVTNSGLKGFTKEHGLTEYWSHRITYCASPPYYPKLFCWVYRHEGKKLKHELRCHAVLCTKESISKKITEELQVKLKQALVEFKKDRISKQNARLSLANSVYDNPSMPRRKIMLSVGAMNYRPPLERSKSAPKLVAIEELCSEEDEEEAEMNAKQDGESWSRTSMGDLYGLQTLDRRRPDMKSPRKTSCPEGVINRTLSEPSTGTIAVSDELLNLIVKESLKNGRVDDISQSNSEKETKLLDAIIESNELSESVTAETECKAMMQSNYLVTDSDDGSVSSGCETASTVTDTEPSSLPSLPQEDNKDHTDSSVSYMDQTFEPNDTRSSNRSYNSIHLTNGSDITVSEEVNHVPIGEKNTFRRRSTYPPLRVDSTLTDFGEKFESLIDNLTDVDSLNSSTENEVFKNTGDNDSACSDESGYSELLDGKDSIIGNTIMV